jgi:inner membrane protein
MVGKTHVVFGLTNLAVADIATRLIQPHLVQGIPAGPLLCICAAIAGSLAPDLDSQEGSQFQYELGETGQAISKLFRLLGVKHRGLTHYGITTLIVMVVSALLAWWAGYLDVGLAFGLGYLSHVFADSMTVAGTPLLWPKKGRFHILPRALRFRTGGAVETLIFTVITMALVFLLPASILGAVSTTQAS